MWRHWKRVIWAAGWVVESVDGVLVWSVVMVVCPPRAVLCQSIRNIEVRSGLGGIPGYTFAGLNGGLFG